MTDHWFWFALTAACLLWYSSITLYVAIKGAQDIRTMLGRLGHTARDATNNATKQVSDDADNES